MRRFAGVLVLRRLLSSRAGRMYLTSLLPACRPAEPSQVEPSVAFNAPSPLEKTMKRRSRVFAETRMSSGPYKVSSGAGSLVGVWMTGPVTLTPAGASDADAGVDLSTVTFPHRVNSRPSRTGGATSFDSFGNETYARGLAPQVFHGTDSEAVLPETTKGLGLEPFAFAE